jgi:hypothetical protein
MDSAGLCVYNNNWFNIYDFNAFEGDDNHWSLLPSLDNSTLVEEASKHLPVTMDPSMSVIPYTIGLHKEHDLLSMSTAGIVENGGVGLTTTRSLVVLFSDGEEDRRARSLIDRTYRRNVSIL